MSWFLNSNSSALYIFEGQSLTLTSQAAFGRFISSKKCLTSDLRSQTQVNTSMRLRSQTGNIPLDCKAQGFKWLVQDSFSTDLHYSVPLNRQTYKLTVPIRGEVLFVTKCSDRWCLCMIFVLVDAGMFHRKLVWARDHSKARPGQEQSQDLLMMMICKMWVFASILWPANIKEAHRLYTLWPKASTSQVALYSPVRPNHLWVEFSLSQV